MFPPHFDCIQLREALLGGKEINMSYGVKKRKNGNYYAYVSVYLGKDKNGKEKKREYGAGTYSLKREAVAAAKKKEVELSRGSDVDLLGMSFADYYHYWFNTFKKNTVSLGRQRNYLHTGELIKDFFKDKRPNEIRRSDYQVFLNQYGKDHAKSTVEKVAGACRAAVRSAIDDDIITKDFTKNTKLVYNKAHERKVEYLSEAELRRFKAVLLSDMDRHNTGRFMILTAIYTGMRKQEVQALTWNDIDFDNRTITIDKAWNDQEKNIKSTKTENSNRTIPVNPELLRYLKLLRENGSDKVFANKFGSLATSSALSKLIRSILKQAKIEKKGFAFHSLRHVHVAYLLSKGVDIAAISKRLGHANVTITLNRYAYMMEELKARNDEKIVNELSDL